MKHPGKTLSLAVLVTTLSLCVYSALAWHDEGHYYSAVAAVEALPEDVPAFFRQGAKAVGHNALDPDVFKQRDLSQLNHCEFPEHFIDLEMLEGNELPPLRYDYIRLCQRLGVEPDKAGTLPYAIAEWTQKLTMAFAEHRANPDNEHVRAKCLVYAGTLAHYAADLHMPLHTTIHWDGRAEEHTPYTRTGIHNKVDALPTKMTYNELFEEPLPTPLAAADVFSFTMEELAKSHALVDAVYDMESDLPEWDSMRLVDEDVRAFTRERTRAAAAFTADLFLSAWRNSAGIDTPSWLDRRVFDETLDRDEIPEQPGQ